MFLLKLLPKLNLERILLVALGICAVSLAWYVYHIKQQLNASYEDIQLLEDRSVIMTHEITKNIQLLDEQAQVFSTYMDLRTQEVELLKLRHEAGLARAKSLAAQKERIHNAKDVSTISDTTASTIQWMLHKD